MFDVSHQRVIHIHSNGKPHRVHPIKHFPTSVLVEPNSGKFFMSYWRLAKKRGERRQRAFREYPDVYSLFRSLVQTNESTKRKRIPTLEDLRTECIDINVHAGTISAADNGAIAQAKKSMAKILERLENAKTIELKEANEQLECAIVFRDSKNRLNVGVVCARLVAARNRLKERMENILYWLNRYSEWSEAISIFLAFHRRYLPRLETRLAELHRDVLELEFRRSNTDRIVRFIERIITEIQNLKFLGGWRNWALQCTKDLNMAIQFVREGATDAAAQSLRKVIQATRLKLIQYEIHELLMQIDLDQIEKIQNAPDHIKAIKAIEKTLDSIDETDFRTPVIDKLREKLSAAAALLAKNMKPKDKKEMKDYLRFAYQMI